MSHQLVDWVEFTWIFIILGFSVFRCLPYYACVNENLGEAVWQLRKIVDYLDQSLTNPSLRADRTPCIYE